MVLEDRFATLHSRIALLVLEDRFASAPLEDRFATLHSRIVRYTHLKIVRYTHSKNFKALRADLQGLCPVFKQSDLQGLCPIFKPQAIFKALRADLQAKRLKKTANLSVYVSLAVSKSLWHGICLY